MRLITLNNESIEVFVGKHLPEEDTQWILDETVQVKNFFIVNLN